MGAPSGAATATPPIRPQVPILRREYSDSAPIKEHTSVGDFLDRYWLQKSAAASLHQWQFPLSKTAVPKLCYRCAPPPCLDEDLLKHWLDICLDYFSTRNPSVAQVRPEVAQVLRRTCCDAEARALSESLIAALGNAAYA